MPLTVPYFNNITYSDVDTSSRVDCQEEDNIANAAHWIPSNLEYLNSARGEFQSNYGNLLHFPVSIRLGES